MLYKNYIRIIYIIYTKYTHYMHHIHIHIGCFHAFPCIARIKLVIYDMSLECKRHCVRTKCWRSTLSRRWLRQARRASWLGNPWDIRNKIGEWVRTHGKDHHEMRRIHENIWETMGTYGKNIDKWRFWWAFPAFPLCNGHFNGKLITLNWEFFSMPCLIT
jgi:hypothetical protein